MKNTDISLKKKKPWKITSSVKTQRFKRKNDYFGFLVVKKKIKNFQILE